GFIFFSNCHRLVKHHHANQPRITSDMEHGEGSFQGGGEAGEESLQGLSEGSFQGLSEARIDYQRLMQGPIYSVGIKSVQRSFSKKFWGCHENVLILAYILSNQNLQNQPERAVRVFAKMRLHSHRSLKNLCSFNCIYLYLDEASVISTNVVVCKENT
ncbi:hypothetical protein RYX36_009808, partial [Vicia faba]